MAVAPSLLGAALWSASPLHRKWPKQIRRQARVNIHGPTSWRPCLGLGISSNKCEHVAGARCAAEHAHLQAAVPTRLATARQVRKRFTIWALRLGGRALALADFPRNAGMSPAREAPRGAEKRSWPQCCPRALQPRGKCENGLRFGPYVLAAARWSWQIVQEMRACCRRAMRGTNHADLQAAVRTGLATARQVRKRFAILGPAVRWPRQIVQ